MFHISYAVAGNVAYMKHNRVTPEISPVLPVLARSSQGADGSRGTLTGGIGSPVKYPSSKERKMVKEVYRGTPRWPVLDVWLRGSCNCGEASGGQVNEISSS